MPKIEYLPIGIPVSQINGQTGTSYILALTDANNYVEMSSTSQNIVTIPASGTTNFAVGTEINIVQTSTGTTQISAAGGVTLNYYSPTTSSSAILKGQWSALTVVKRATDTWAAIGNII